VSEQGWLIELPTTVGRDPYWSHLGRSSPEWLSAERGFFHWSYDSREAMRFARKKDAEDFLRCYARADYKAVQAQSVFSGQTSEYLAGHKGSCRLRHWDRNTPCVCDCSFDPPPAPASTPRVEEYELQATPQGTTDAAPRSVAPPEAARRLFRCEGCGKETADWRPDMLQIVDGVLRHFAEGKWCGPVVPETPGKEGEARPAGGTEALPE
jgi:hypothetical protein